jgi:hypothetical protein
MMNLGTIVVVVVVLVGMTIIPAVGVAVVVVGDFPRLSPWEERPTGGSVVALCFIERWCIVVGRCWLADPHGCL